MSGVKPPVEPPAQILVVDDDISSGALLVRLLEAAGYQVQHVLDPRKAVPLLRIGHYALAILDYDMPGMTGLALLEALRKEFTLPVIMLTAADRSELAVRALRLGAFDYLTKPVDEKRLIDTVRQVIETGTRPGDRISHYEIDREIGRGGMGIVYAARDPRLDRPVALKVLLPDFAADPGYELKFLGEARNAAKFSHPNLVTVYEAGRYRGRLFMAMEFVKGELLETSVHAGIAWPPARVFEIGAQIAAALEVIHDAGMVHRDLKPSNLILTTGAGVKILDFGLVRASGPATENDLDLEGDCSGTLSYAPPEVLNHRKADARGDLYALGIVLYELLTGQRAFHSKLTTDVMRRILEGQPSKPLSELGGLPPEAIALLTGLMAVDPARRIGSAAEVRAALQSLRRISGDRRARTT